MLVPDSSPMVHSDESDIHRVLIKATIITDSPIDASIARRVFTCLFHKASMLSTLSAFVSEILKMVLKVLLSC